MSHGREIVFEDLVARLRSECVPPDIGEDAADLLGAMKDRITRLDAENRRLKAAAADFHGVSPFQDQSSAQAMEEYT